MSSFRYREKVFRVVVNARTGEVAGDRPYSGWKIFFFVLLIVALITGLIVLIVMLKKPAEPELVERVPVSASWSLPPAEESLHLRAPGPSPAQDERVETAQGRSRNGMRPPARSPSPLG